MLFDENFTVLDARSVAKLTHLGGRVARIETRRQDVSWRTALPDFTLHVERRRVEARRA
jgi:hypothetical protein